MYLLAAATFRFLERADLEYDSIICSTRSFTLQKYPDKKDVLYYDCCFLDALDEGKVLNVDLELSKAGSVQIRKLLVKVLPYHAVSKCFSLFFFEQYSGVEIIWQNVPKIF